jgi:hypothetical protein
LGDFALAEIAEIEESLEQQNVQNADLFYDKFLIQERKVWAKRSWVFETQKNISIMMLF